MRNGKCSCFLSEKAEPKETWFRKHGRSSARAHMVSTLTPLRRLHASCTTRTCEVSYYVLRLTSEMNVCHEKIEFRGTAPTSREQPCFLRLRRRCRVTSHESGATQRVVKRGGPSADCFYLFLCFMSIKQLQWWVIGASEGIRMSG